MRDQLETDMLNGDRQGKRSRIRRCAICDGKFGLVRYYCSRTPLCSKKCVDHFKARRDSDTKWLWRCRAA
jgi:hypothetical protein